jgi:cell division protein ZapD
MIYEQPLNEQSRLCLRLEYLFAQAKHYLAGESMWDSHQALKIILEILQAIDHTNIKNRFCQTLNQYAHILSRLGKSNQVDKQKLDNTLKKIDLLIDGLHASSKKIGHQLRENGFLAVPGLVISLNLKRLSICYCSYFVKAPPSKRL